MLHKQLAKARIDIPIEESEIITLGVALVTSKKRTGTTSPGPDISSEFSRENFSSDYVELFQPSQKCGIEEIYAEVHFFFF
ncbi:MAG: hypothetical protein ACI97A_003092 [Planctomycetota bacterium]